MSDERTIEDFLRDIVPGRESVLDIDSSGSSSTIRFGARKLQPELPDPPIRAESPARAHVFHNAQGVLNYLEQHAADPANVIILGDVHELVVSITLDESADMGREQLLFHPQLDPRVKDWLGILSRPMPVLAFAQFVLEHRRQVVTPNPADLVLVFGQMTSQTKVTVSQGRGKQALNGVMVESKISGGKGEQFLEIPDVITIQCPIFVAGDPVQIDIDLLVHAPDPEKIVVTATSSDFETQKIEAFEHMLDQLGGDGYVVGRGKTAYRDWKYLKSAE